MVTIGKDGFTTVKTNIWTEPEGSYVTFSGKLNAKGILVGPKSGRRDRYTYWQVKSAREIVMMGAQDYVTSKLCAPREAPPEGSRDARRTPAPPANATSKRAPDTVPVDDVEKELTQISFKEVKSPDIAKLYPFLKELVETKGETWSMGSIRAFPPKALVAEIRDKATNLYFLFLYLQNSKWCDSTTGCAFSVYADEGQGYHEVMGAAAKGPVYLLKDRDKTSLIICSVKYNAEWSFENHAFKFKAKYAAKNAPSCN